jgi:transcriptional regulator with XRE-family HTH domain
MYMLTKKDIRSVRKETGLTQEDFAKKVGVSVSLVAMTEAGIKPVSRAYLQKLASKLKKTFIITVKPKRK